MSGGFFFVVAFFLMTIDDGCRILILAGGVFYYGSQPTDGRSPAGLFDAYDLIRDLVGQGGRILFFLCVFWGGQD